MRPALRMRGRDLEPVRVRQGYEKAKMISNARLLQAESSVNLATVPYSGDGDEVGAVVHGVDHAVITGADAKVRPMASQRQETRGPRITGQTVDDLSDRLPHGRVELP